MTKYAKILSDVTNRFIVQIPGHEPGAVIQGDDLITLVEDSHDLLKEAIDTNDSELIFSAKKVYEKLRRFSEHYFRATNSGELASAELRRDYSEKKVVIAEDDKVIREMLIEILIGQFPGLEIGEYTNGLDALKDILETTPTFLITDMMMPVMNGAELLKAMIKEKIEIPVLVMSGFFETKEKVSEFGSIPMEYYEYLKKPFTVKEFVEIIDSFLHK